MLLVDRNAVMVAVQEQIGKGAEPQTGDLRDGGRYWRVP